jgi:hypothetical protein
MIAVGLVVMLNLLAASPELHRWFHADAGGAGHECAVTLFAHGQVDSAAVQIPVLPPPPMVEMVLVATFSPCSLVIDTLHAGRAPPASSFVS